LARTLNGMSLYELRTVLQEALADGIYGLAFLQSQIDVCRGYLVHMEPAAGHAPNIVVNISKLVNP